MRIARQNAQTSLDRKNISIVGKEFDAAQSDMDDLDKLRGSDVFDEEGWNAAKARRDRAALQMRGDQIQPTDQQAQLAAIMKANPTWDEAKSKRYLESLGG